jgi:16S rRNA C967 or C1407 C5-methylase (RsmB/RsmF family)
LVEDLLLAQGYVFGPEPFSPWACQLMEGPKPLGASIAAAFGLIYIQDRSSMLAPLLLQPPRGGLVLDMCASPGSKTGLLAQLVGQTGLVLANEPNERRLATLRHNLAAMNLVQVATCRYPGQRLPLIEASLPCIQLDPPCSGWGTVKRNPRVLEIWPEHKLGPLLDLQRDLLRHAARMLAPGGRLLYSTCTTNPAENQEQVQWALDALGLLSAPLPALPGTSIADVQGGQRSWMQVSQDDSRGQGFFFAALTKADRAPPEDVAPHGHLDMPGEPVGAEELSRGAFVAWDKLPPGHLAQFNGRIIFLHEKSCRFPRGLHWQGFELGRLHGKAFRLNSRLRMLLPMHTPETGLCVEDIRDLEALLQGRSLPLPGRLARCAGSGSVGLYWRDLPLGWLTVKGARCLWSPR